MMRSVKDGVLTRTTLAWLVAAMGVGTAAVPTAVAQEPFLGEIRIVGFNFCPRGWAETHGQLLPIAQNTALFSLLGTMYGGDGRTTFALPDLRGRAPAGVGQGPGLSAVVQGEKRGAETAQLTLTQLPSHTHAATTQVSVKASTAAADSSEPGNRVWARAVTEVGGDGKKGRGKGDQSASASTSIYGSGGDVTMAADAASAETVVGPAGGSAPLPVLDPSLGVKYCIALQGIYPSRS